MAELRILSARAVMAAAGALGDAFARASGHVLRFEFAPVGALEERLAAGESADVVILSRAAIGTMEASGRLIAGTVRELGRTSIGVCVAAGAAVPDVSTPEAFRALLLRARAIALSDAAIGGTAARYLPQLFARMQIAEALASRLIPCRGGGGEVARRVARGEAEIGLTFISEMLAVAGVTVAGPLPGTYANDTRYCAGVWGASRAPEAARALIAALVDAGSEEVWRRAGFSR